MSQQPLTPAEIRLAQYGQRTSTWSTATYNDGTEKALHEIALGLKAEVDRVRAELAAAREQAITDVGDWLDKHGQKNAAYLVRTVDIPAADSDGPAPCSGCRYVPCTDCAAVSARP